MIRFFSSLGGFGRAVAQINHAVNASAEYTFAAGDGSGSPVTGARRRANTSHVPL